MKKAIVKRYPKQYQELYFKSGSKVVAVNFKDLKRTLGVDSIIKFFKKDFKAIKPHARRLTHFNIQHCGHKPNERYVLVEIAKPGSFDGKKDIPPVLNASKYAVTLCTGVRNTVRYDQLKASDFKYSLKHIHDVPSLQKTIVRRYKKSLAHLTNSQKLDLGVAITELRIQYRSTHNVITQVNGEMHGKSHRKRSLSKTA